VISRPRNQEAFQHL